MSGWITIHTTTAHAACLHRLGLYPWPDDAENVEAFLGPSLLDSITTIVSQQGLYSKPHNVIDSVLTALEERLQDLGDPDHVQFMVRHWIITRCGPRKHVTDDSSSSAKDLMRANTCVQLMEHIIGLVTAHGAARSLELDKEIQLKRLSIEEARIHATLSQSLGESAREDECDTKRRRVEQFPVLENGCYSLVEAVLGPLEMTKSNRRAAVQRLTNEFLPGMTKHWSCLFPTVPSRSIHTYIDVNQDPVVPRLRDWILSPPGTPAPLYPVHPDQRPAMPVPTYLQAISADVWADVVDSDHCVQKALEPYEDIYNQTHGMVVEIANAPANERLRQWQRVTRSPCVTFLQIVETLGWQDVLYDSQSVYMLTAAIMRRDRPDVDPGDWFHRSAECNMWNWKLCIPAMRTAAIMVSRLRMGQADLRWLVHKLSEKFSILE